MIVAGENVLRRLLWVVAAVPIAVKLCCVAAVAQAAGSAATSGSPPVAAKPVSVASPTVDDQRVAVHAQATFVVQGNPRFRAAFEGPNSLLSGGETRETADLTLYVGVKPWGGGELWFNPEIDQGFGLANTLGAAGFPSGEAYKVGKANPYTRIQRLFFRQTIGLGGANETVEADLNQLAGHRRADRFVLTIGKFSVGDVFDTNTYAHDPRADFLNWSVIDAGSFDYAADAWGYTYGGSAELYRGRFALRAGLFNLSKVPNSENLETDFRQYEALAEVEERHSLGGHEGKLKITAFVNHGEMALLRDATILATTTRQIADVALVRRVANRAGLSINAEQSVTGSLGVFARAGFADDRYEAFEFTDIDQTVSAGLSYKGTRWGRANDRLGVALVINRAAAPRRGYLDAGGLGILIGDGALPHPGDEHIVESYYDFSVTKNAHISFDAQLIDHPGYNLDRGPVVILGGRLHAQL